ncbi:hypothetical protein BH20ACT16_BH20ACT16_10730 [soil metagenome]
MQPALIPEQLTRLSALLDEQAGRYRKLNGGRHLGEYLARARTREDEELLTEPVLAAMLEHVLGFPTDAYFPQLGRSGLKPDFTPIDLVAHRFVIDAKSSLQHLDGHERQIRSYIDQRHLDYGVLFNLRELRVYRRGTSGHDASLSFDVGRLWQVARGEALDIDEVARFVRFCELFGHRSMGVQEKIQRVAEAEPWRDRAGLGDELQIDLEFLVSQLRSLSRLLAEDAAAQHERLLADIELNPEHERRLRRSGKDLPHRGRHPPRANDLRLRDRLRRLSRRGRSTRHRRRWTGSQRATRSARGPARDRARLPRL